MPRYIDAERMPNDKFWENLTDKEKAKVLAYLLSSPTADVEEVKHGEWINKYYDPLDNRWYHTCNQCKRELQLTFCDNYCRNCGAKMDGKDKQNIK